MPEEKTAPKKRGRPRKKPQLETTSVTLTAGSITNARISVSQPEVEKLIERYVSDPPENTSPTWLHAPECPRAVQTLAGCERHGCDAFVGADVKARIELGWWNDLPGGK